MALVKEYINFLYNKGKRMNMKKLIVTAFTLGASAVFAGTMGPVCTPGNSTVPCRHSAWSFGGEALYLQPRYSGADFLGSTVDASSDNLRYPSANDNWNWGFKLEGAYHFYTGNDLNLNWSHFNTTSNRTITPPMGGRFLDLVDNTYYGSVSASRKPTWDAVNLELGQRVNFGDKTDIRFHGGIQYARINTDISYSAPLSSGTTSAALNLLYNGFGPRAGFDITYHLIDAIAIYSQGAGSLLIGPNKFSEAGAGTTAATWFSILGSTTTLVPEIEAKLGATYTYASSIGPLNLDLGWLWINYFNAQQNSLAEVPAGIQQSDFGLQGPYIGLKWLGNVA